MTTGDHALNYLVCATPRTGSSVICEGLSATDAAGRPLEYFTEAVMATCCTHWGVPPPGTAVDYLRLLGERTRTSNGVFGAKAMFGELTRLLKRLPMMEGLTPARVLDERLLPGLRYIRVIRRDVLRQAVSHLRARQTDHWSLLQAQTQAAKAEPTYDFAQLDAVVAKEMYLRAKWDEFLADAPTPPAVVYYEDFVADQAGTVSGLLAALGIEIPTPLFQRPMYLERQGDALNEEWIERYRLDKERSQAG